MSDREHEARFKPIIPFGQQRHVGIPVEHAVFIADFLKEESSKVGVFLVDGGQRGQELAERLVNTELVGSNGEAKVVILIDQMDINAIGGIVSLTRSVQGLRAMPDQELLYRAERAGVIFDNMTAQIIADN